MQDKEQNLPLLKKRGRKPKNKIIENKCEEIVVNSEEEPIIMHLPISLEDVVNEEVVEDKIFIKSEKSSIPDL